MDVGTWALAAALASDNVRVETGAKVERLEAAPEGRCVAAVQVRTISVLMTTTTPGAGRSASPTRWHPFPSAKRGSRHAASSVFPSIRTSTAPGRKGGYYQLTQRNARRSSAASSLFETGGFWRVGPEPGRPDVQFHLGLGSGIEAGVAKLARAGVTLNSAYLQPESRGTVRLASPDPADAPLIDPNYWAESNDRATAFRGLRVAREMMRQDALKPFVAREALLGPGVDGEAALFGYARASAKTDHHPVGTCCMGHGDMAVVDPGLKVRGIEGLRVADSSVMPRIPSCNTNAPTIMIGEKASDLILGREPLPPAVFEGNEPRLGGDG